MLKGVVSLQVKNTSSREAADLRSEKSEREQTDAGRPIDLSSKNSTEPDTSKRHQKNTHSYQLKCVVDDNGLLRFMKT